MKFKFGDKVRVNMEFYKNTEGVIVGYHHWYAKTDAQSAKFMVKFQLANQQTQFNQSEWIDETLLELIES
jgi:hypothetical protein